jgi:hypothetical protein
MRVAAEGVPIMTLHFHSGPWQVHDEADGLRVTFTDGNLDPETLPILVDELVDLAQAGGGPILYLDMGTVTLPVEVLVSKLVELNQRLRAAGRRLVLANAAPALASLFRAETLSVTKPMSQPDAED